MHNIYLDTETTDKVKEKIAELSMIIEEANTNKFVKAVNYFFTVEKMSEEALSVHHLDQGLLYELSGGAKFSDKAAEIYNILKGNRIIAHNEVFDERFISSELWRCGISFAPGDRFCTMKYFKDVLQIPSKFKKYGKYKNPKLSEVVDFLGIDKDKVISYSERWFNYSSKDMQYHDSRFDTAAMYIAVNIYREVLHGKGEWMAEFTK